MSKSLNWYDNVVVRINRCNSSINALARESGLSRQSFVNWKNNPDSVSADSLERIVSALERIEQRTTVTNVSPLSKQERKSKLLGELAVS